MPATFTRKYYKPSGEVDWPRFIPFAAVVLIGSAVAALLMNLLFEAGNYWIFFVPLAAALLVGIILWKAVRIGRCRSPWMAAFLGAIAAIVIYMGYFYFGMVYDYGQQYSRRLDLIPRYIKLRIDTEVTHDAGKPETPGYSRPLPVMNWFQFIFEFGILLYFLPSLGYRLASRPYCNRCGDWKQQEVILLPARSGRVVAKLLESRQVEKYTQVIQDLQDYVGRKKFTSVMVECCPTQTAGQPCPTYLSVKDVAAGSKLSSYQKMDGAMGIMRVRRAELTPEEIDALSFAFRILKPSVAVAGSKPQTK